MKHLLLILTALALILSGCGKSDDTAPSNSGEGTGDSIIADSQAARESLRQSIDNAQSVLESSKKDSEGYTGKYLSNPPAPVTPATDDSDDETTETISNPEATITSTNSSEAPGSNTSPDYSSDNFASDLLDKNGEGLGDVKVDTKLNTVTVRLPALLVEAKTQSDMDEAVKRNGYKSGKLNSDGSAEITMDKSMYESKIKELEGTLRNILKETAEDDELPNVDSAEADPDFRTITVYVKSKPGLMDYMSSLAFAAPMATYHIFC